MPVRSILVASAAAFAFFSMASTAALACGAAPEFGGVVVDPAVDPDPSPADVAQVSPSPQSNLAGLKAVPEAKPGKTVTPPAVGPES